MLDTDGTIHRPTEDQKGWERSEKGEKESRKNMGLNGELRRVVQLHTVNDLVRKKGLSKKKARRW